MARLRLAPVEYRVCHRCVGSPPAAANRADAVDLDAGAAEYEGDRCPRCAAPFDPRRGRRVTHERLILVGVAPPVYELERRVRCRNRQCDNLYAGPACPLCGAPRAQRFTSVWVRQFSEEPLGQYVGRSE